MIEVNGLSKHYGGVRAVDNVSFKVERGEIVLSTHRLAYDHHGAAAAMRSTGHADGYASTLVTGVWPSLDILPPAERAASGQRLATCTLRLPRTAAPAAAE